MKKNDTLILLMCLSGLSAIIYPILGIIVPLIFWIVKRSIVQNIHKYGLIVMTVQFVWLIALYIAQYFSFMSYMESGNVSIQIFSDQLHLRMIFWGIDILLIGCVILYMKIRSSGEKN